MGCQSSSLEQRPLCIRLSVLDSAFVKTKNQAIRDKMDKLQIKYEVYLSLDCLIDDISKIYSNQIVTIQDQLPGLQRQLSRLNFKPNIYVLKNNSEQKNIQNENSYRCFSSYEAIIEELNTKTLRKRKSSISPVYKKGQKIVVKIFRNKEENGSDDMIFKQTLKNKKLSFQIYKGYLQLQNSMKENSSRFIVTDYVYHRQVLNLVEGSDVRVICFCDLLTEYVYDPRIYFVTNNFLQLVSEIASEEKLRSFNSVKCSKVYIYGSQQSYLSEYCALIESFDFGVKILSDLGKIIKESKYFFAVTIIISPQDRKDVQKQLQMNDYLFKTKLIEIKKGTENSMNGLRKTIKQLKKGYKAQKGVTKSIDIIDKHFENVKFDNIKQELEKSQIKCYGFVNLSGYMKHKKIVSPFIICNYQERLLLVRYLNEIQSRAKVILFCNKNNISSELKDRKHFAFVSSHFGKILKFIRKNSVYNPHIIDENDNQIKEKKEKLKNRNKRISALKWCGIGEQAGNKDKEHAQLEKDFQFLNINSMTNQSQIRQIQKESAGFFKLDYRPSDNNTQFRTDLVQSFKAMKDIFKIAYPEDDFQVLLSSIKTLSISDLTKKVREFFTSQNELGLKINNALIDIEKLSKKEITSMREFLYLVNLNYLSMYRMQAVGNTKLYHYLQSDLIENCEEGSFLLNKNYYVFYEQQSESVTNTDNLSKYRIEFNLQYNSMGESDPLINSYFRFGDKFIFSPFSQFLITHKEEVSPHLTIIRVEYKKNVEFLKQYYADNLLTEKSTIIDLFEQEIKNNSSESTSQALLVDSSNIEQISRNLERSKAMKAFKNGDIKTAIEMQKKLIAGEQSLENFDCQKLEWINYELACFYFKDQDHVECEKLLQELLEAEPSHYLKDRVKLLQNYYKERKPTKQCSIKETKGDNQEMFKTVTLEQSDNAKYVNKEEEEESDEISLEENIFDKAEIQNELPYIEMDRIDDFEEECKENIAV